MHVCTPDECRGRGGQKSVSDSLALEFKTGVNATKTVLLLYKPARNTTNFQHDTSKLSNGITSPELNSQMELQLQKVLFHFKCNFIAFVEFKS